MNSRRSSQTTVERITRAWKGPLKRRNEKISEKWHLEKAQKKWKKIIEEVEISIYPVYRIQISCSLFRFAF